MKSIKNILKTSIYMIIFFIISSLIVTIFNYFNILNYKTMNILKIIIFVLTFVLGGFLIGKKSAKNGWLEGLKLSSFMSVILVIVTLIMDDFTANYLIYILVLIISSILGSILGINKK